MTTFHTAKVEGLNVFYREAGDPANPKLLLLGGFPSSSHQFRNLIPALADRFHVAVARLPGLRQHRHARPGRRGTTPSTTSPRSSTACWHEVGFTGPMGIYMQDYGGPIGNRIIAAHPDWLQWQVIQNANTYEEGFTEAWDGIRHALWVDRSPETEAPLEAFLQPDTVKAIYTTGHPDLEQDQPRQLEHGPVLPRPPPRPPRAARPVLRLPHQRRAVPDVAGVAARAAAAHARSSGVRATSSSPPQAARPTSATCPTPSSIRLDSGHFAVEDNLDEIAGGIDPRSTTTAWRPTTSSLSSRRTVTKAGAPGSRPGSARRGLEPRATARPSAATPHRLGRQPHLESSPQGGPHVPGIRVITGARSWSRSLGRAAMDR